ncbi:MAG: NAD-dependent epimerase [Rhodospirillaceae bacterium]|nr:NAD-dependent epimerase [Rhodospirillaceae bacterium]|tara:strand:+ start:622 stop:1611 length:990 start_codon:yes stop_codon:yes gene_type:complete
MNITITGGSGFLGQKLARRLLGANVLSSETGSQAQVEKITLLDVVEPPEDLKFDPRITVLTGDITDRSLLEQAIPSDTNSVFHLAAVVSAGAEEDFDLGLAVNLDASRCILDICRGHGTKPKLVFASSCAAFGGDMPDVIADMTARTPQTSYGTQKVIGELLVNDYARKGFVDGRALRFPTVVVRPGKPNKAASTFASSIIREPLRGERATCPVKSESKMFLASPRSIIENIVHAHNLTESNWGMSREVTLPGFSMSIGGIAEALRSVAGDVVASRIDWIPDPFIQEIVDGWPPEFDTKKALDLGFIRDKSMENVIEAFIEDELQGSIA